MRLGTLVVDTTTMGGNAAVAIAPDDASAESSRSPSLTEQVYDRLKEDILRARREPGELVIEADLAHRYGVSKTPVREALRLLAQDNWVVVLPRKGYLIRPMQLNDVREIFTLRSLIEPALCADAAAMATEKDLVRLKTLVAAQAHAASDLDSALASAQEFHLALSEIVRNTRAQSILTGLLDEVRRLHYLMPSVEGHVTSSEELQAHGELLSALENRDSATASRLMHEHLNEVAITLVQAFGGVQRRA
ncbi:MAG: hypothetical protein QOJ11_2772 [Frankiales bacterium]|jgi:DNA-binding GntR family transcriptional regulator|nr:hypothetical protein [Frankiales bacterium]